MNWLFTLLFSVLPADTTESRWTSFLGPMSHSTSTAKLPLPVGPPKPGQLTGIDPSSGETLWELSGLFGNSSSTPVMAEPGQVLVGASAGREGGPSKEAISTNGLVAIKQDSSGKWQAEYLWHATKATCGFCSPAMHNGMAYFVDRRGMVHCLDANTGKEAYMERLGHPVWATPIGAGDRVYFVGEEGVTTVVKQEPSLKLLHRTHCGKRATQPSMKKTHAACWDEPGSTQWFQCQTVC